MRHFTIGAMVVLKVRHGVVSWMVRSMPLAHSRGPRVRVVERRHPVVHFFAAARFTGQGDATNNCMRLIGEPRLDQYWDEFIAEGPPWSCVLDGHGNALGTLARPEN